MLVSAAVGCPFLSTTERSTAWYVLLSAGNFGGIVDKESAVGARESCSGAPWAFSTGRAPTKVRPINNTPMAKIPVRFRIFSKKEPL